jgi:hypothetical protein
MFKALDGFKGTSKIVFKALDGFKGTPKIMFKALDGFKGTSKSMYKALYGFKGSSQTVFKALDLFKSLENIEKIARNFQGPCRVQEYRARHIQDLLSLSTAKRFSTLRGSCLDHVRLFLPRSPARLLDPFWK